MKFDPLNLSSIIEENYSHLMPNFFEMQTEYLASLNIIYDDLDASLVAMVITNQLYKNTIKSNGNFSNISFKTFYEKEKFKLPVSNLKIKEISSTLNLPRETVRRKKEKLIKDKIIILDKKNNLYSLNTDRIDKKILQLQIYNISKFLSKFSIFFTKKNPLVEEVGIKQIEKDVNEKFLIYLTKFLDFQISYFANLKTVMDIESVFISILCTMNTLTSKGYQNEKPLNIKNIFCRLHELNDRFGLNASSISEITKIPRTTVIRKITNLEKTGILKRDKFNRYSPDDLTVTKKSKKLLPAMEYSLELLGIFFSQCLETYSLKN